MYIVLYQKYEDYSTNLVATFDTYDTYEQAKSYAQSLNGVVLKEAEEADS